MLKKLHTKPENLLSVGLKIYASIVLVTTIFYPNFITQEKSIYLLRLDAIYLLPAASMVWLFATAQIHYNKKSKFQQLVMKRPSLIGETMAFILLIPALISLIGGSSVLSDIEINLYLSTHLIMASSVLEKSKKYMFLYSIITFAFVGLSFVMTGDIKSFNLIKRIYYLFLQVIIFIR